MSDIVEAEPGVYSVLLNGASFEARIGDGEIWINGYAFPYRSEDPRQWKRASAPAAAGDRAAVLAPMPGKVVRVLVNVDEEVEAGRAVVVVEAMKMQNELKASHAGRVSSIAVKENDSVNAGAVLVVIDRTR